LLNTYILFKHLLQNTYRQICNFSDYMLSISCCVL